MKSSYFSWFFREATYEERESVFLEVARKACEEQQAIIDQAKLITNNYEEHTNK